MLLWICFALLAAAVATLLMRAGPAVDRAPHDPDLAVYRDQLTELETDAERGVIDKAQAAAARAEIARRLLKQAAPAKATRAASGPIPAGTFLLAAAAAVPLLSLGLYIAVGSPGLPGRPLAARLAEPADPANPIDMIAKVEARLREKPDDGLGWSVIAPVYVSQGRFADAAQAYGKAMSLLGESPDRIAGFAKSTIKANNGIVTEPARQAYERLKIVDPERIEADFWLGMYDEQNGRPDAAAAAYLKLLSSAPPDAPWRKAVEERLAAVTGKGGAIAAEAQKPPGVAPPELAPLSGPAAAQKLGPTPAEFVAAAQKLAPEMREQMIGGRMVPKARDAVKANPRDVSAWSRIVTGLAALGKSAEAQAALTEAKQSLSGDAAGLTELDALAKALGLNS